MRPVKVRGIYELGLLRRRIRSAAALGRIGTADADSLDRKLDDIEGFIINMREFDENGEEVGSAETI